MYFSAYKENQKDKDNEGAGWKARGVRSFMTAMTAG